MKRLTPQGATMSAAFRPCSCSRMGRWWSRSWARFPRIRSPRRSRGICRNQIAIIPGVSDSLCDAPYLFLDPFGSTNFYKKQMDRSAAPLVRCHWAKSPLSIAYHDEEWGVPVHDERKLFEFLILEGAQAGLSWDTVLKKRDRYRQRFVGFDPEKVARF